MKPLFILNIILSFISFQSYEHQKSNYWDEIRKSANLKEDEYLVTVLYTLGDCNICFTKNQQEIRCLNKKIERINNIKIKYLALIFCNRDLELKVFNNQFSWEYLIMRDKGNSRKKLGLKNDASIALFNYEGKIIIANNNVESGFCTNTYRYLINTK